MTGHTTLVPASAYPSAAQLRKLFDASPDVVCLLNANGCFVAVSAAAARLWGYAPHTLLGLRYLDFLLPADAPGTETALAALLHNAEGGFFQNHFRCADGTHQPFRWQAIWDAEENVVYASAHDARSRQRQDADAEAFRVFAQRQQEALIRRQQETEEELRRSNERFRLAARADAVYDRDVAHDNLYWGEGLHTIFGYSERELQMPQWEAALHPAERAAVVGRLQDCLNNPASDSFEAEYQLRRADGSWAFVHEIGYIQRDDEGKAIRLVGRIQDVSERKRGEFELQKLSLITRQTEDAIIITDPDKKTTWINDAFTRLTGYTLADMLGKRPAAVLEGPTLDPAKIAWVDEQYRSKRPFRIETKNFRKDGTPFWSIISIQPLLDANGEVLEYFSIRKDITERKLLEKQLEQQRQQMTAAVIAAQEKERSDMSQELHDNVNQVLTTVKLYQELCLSGIGNREELTQKSMDLLQDCINEIRSISKRLSAPSLGKIRLHESVRELTDAVAAANKLQITLDTDAIASFECPQTMHIALYRILQEQLTNVLKHASATEVLIGFNLQPDRLLMEVLDNGVGFRPTDHYAGTGLNNVRSRAEGLGGTALLQSKPGAGCRLLVTVPLG